MEAILKTMDNTGTDLSASDGLFVKNNAGVLVLATAATDDVVGVITRGGLTQSDICLFGKCNVKAGAAITKYAQLTATTGGKALTETAGARHIVALALEGATAVDQLIEIMFYGGTSAEFAA